VVFEQKRIKAYNYIPLNITFGNDLVSGVLLEIPYTYIMTIISTSPTTSRGKPPTDLSSRFNIYIPPYR
jgi:hypothetical protein